MNWVFRRTGPLILICIIFIFAAGLGAVIYRKSFSLNPVTRYRSSDDRYTLKVWERGEPEFPFGETICLLVLEADGRKAAETEISVLNDGKHVSADNFSVVWKDDCAEVTVSAEEQEDRQYQLYFE